MKLTFTFCYTQNKTKFSHKNGVLVENKEVLCKKMLEYKKLRCFDILKLN